MELIVTTKSELENLIHSCVRNVLSEQKNQAETEPKNKILSIQEAMVYLNLAKQTLYGFTSKNEIPFIKRGKKLYFRKDDLEKWLMEGKRKSKSEFLKEL